MLVTNLINVGQDGRFQAFANSTRRISPSVRRVRNHISAAFVFQNRYGEVPHGDKHRLHGLWKLEEAREAGYAWVWRVSRI